jgi:hypothetical protein
MQGFKNWRKNVLRLCRRSSISMQMREKKWDLSCKQPISAGNVKFPALRQNINFSAGTVMCGVPRSRRIVSLIIFRVTWPDRRHKYGTGPTGLTGLDVMELMCGPVQSSPVP